MFKISCLLMAVLAGANTAADNEDLLKGLSPEEKKNLLLSLLVEPHDDAAATAEAAHEEAKPDTPSSEMSQEQWRNAMAEDDRHEEFEDDERERPAETPVAKTPRFNYDDVVLSDEDKRLKEFIERKQKGLEPETYDVKSGHPEDYQHHKIMSMLEGMEAQNSKSVGGVTPDTTEAASAQSQSNSVAAAKVEEAAKNAMADLDKTFQSIQNSFSAQVTNYQTRVEEAKEKLQDEINKLASTAVSDQRADKRKELMEREAKIVQTSMANTKELTKQKLQAVLNDYRAQFNQAAATAAMLEAGNATLFARLNYMANTAAIQTKIGLDKIDDSTAAQLAVAKVSSHCVATAGLPEMDLLETEPQIEDFYNATVGDLKAFAGRTAQGGIISGSATAATSLIHRFETDPASFMQKAMRKGGVYRMDEPAASLMQDAEDGELTAANKALQDEGAYSAQLSNANAKTRGQQQKVYNSFGAGLTEAQQKILETYKAMITTSKLFALWMGSLKKNDEDFRSLIPQMRLEIRDTLRDGDAKKVSNTLEAAVKVDLKKEVTELVSDMTAINDAITAFSPALAPASKSTKPALLK